MEEHRGPRLVMQRQLEVEPVRPAPVPAPPPPTEPPAAPTPSAPAGIPSEPSSRALIERQLRWHRERAKFEARRSEQDEPK